MTYGGSGNVTSSHSLRAFIKRHCPNLDKRSQQCNPMSARRPMFGQTPNKRGPCLSGGGGPGGWGPPSCRNVPSAQQIEKLLNNGPFSTWNCHVVDRKQSRIIAALSLRVCWSASCAHKSNDRSAPSFPCRGGRWRTGTLMGRAAVAVKLPSVSLQRPWVAIQPLRWI